METTKLRRFAQYARRTLLELVAARLQLVLQPDSAARRESPKAVKDLEEQIHDSSREQVIDRVAYTWFNRFCALRYMDVNRVNRISVVSPLDGQFQPEILAEAKMGHIDEEMVPTAIQAKVRALLDGTAPSSDPQQEAYRLLVVAVCNYWQRAMPFLFEAIADYTELLMPDDLLSGNSILSYAREAMTPDACQDVEVIGWLYQFYISEKKDAVFEGLKKNQKITPENIPAATQLFTPHWIVRYLVENSLGRLWLLNRPNSRLAEKMDYYIAPQEVETDFLRIAKPEDIKLCDPACGSGHMLTYAFDLLYAIYEEEGLDPAEIPQKILAYNLFGIEIDERAAELAAFALTMKALQYDKRFFRRHQTVRGELVELHICVLRPVKIEPHDLDAYVAEVGRDLFTANLRTLLTQFEKADNFGSLIRPVALDYAELRCVLAEKGVGSQLLLEHVHKDVLRVLEQAEYLSQRYQVVVANPPYMGSGGMNEPLKKFVSKEYPDEKSDLMTCFVERCRSICIMNGFIGMINLPSWLFLGSFEKFRYKLLRVATINSLIHLGRGMFGADFGCVSFVLVNSKPSGSLGVYRRLFTKQSEVSSIEELERRFFDKQYGYFVTNQTEFEKLPGYPIGYWISEAMRKAFIEFESLENIADARIGMATGKNEKYIRNWHEVSLFRTGFNIPSRNDSKASEKKWFPHAKGGEYRKWFGNSDHVVNWQDDGYELQNTLHPSGKRIWAHNFNLEQIFKPAICWTTVTIADTGFRYHPAGYLYDAAAGLCQPKSPDDMLLTLGILNSCVSKNAIKLLNPTVNLAPGYLGKIPVARKAAKNVTPYVEKNIEIARVDWNSFETSWDFSSLPLLHTNYTHATLDATYQQLRVSWHEMTIEMQGLEQENNLVFIDAYGLQDELKPDVPLSEITLTCNPHYRYGNNKSDQEREDLLRADTMREFISYAVGCLFGRYSLDKPGLILANQGETLDDYLRQIPQPRFTPDEDNVIPILDGDWFNDDISGRFREFLRVTFGDEHYEENLRFIEIALGKKDKPLAIRDYFLKEFFADHVNRYKKRPIYWLFSSPKSTFNALIYVHRYRPDTASIVLQYLRDFRSKLVSERDHQEQMSISPSASQGEKTKALKKIEELKKILAELDDYERETLYPLATQQVALDLDDGVKVNYLKLGDALKRIAGLEVAEE